MDRGCEMKADQLLKYCQRLGVRLFAHGGELGVDAPNCSPNAWLSAQLSDRKTELLAMLTSRQQDAAREEHGRLIEEYAAAAIQGRLCPHCHGDDIALIPHAPHPHWGELRCTTCEKWIGWAPTPKALAAGWPMPVGRHKGKTLADIPVPYLEWARDGMSQPRVREMISYYLSHLENNHADAHIA